MRLECLLRPAVLAITKNRNKGGGHALRVCHDRFSQKKSKIYYPLINKLRTK